MIAEYKRVTAGAVTIHDETVSARLPHLVLNDSFA